MNSDGLGTTVYHLLGISFIASAITIVFQYNLQATLGLVLTFICINTLYPDLFPAMGFFIPLGFALRPGQSYAIGQGWGAFGFELLPELIHLCHKALVLRLVLIILGVVVLLQQFFLIPKMLDGVLASPFTSFWR